MGNARVGLRLGQAIKELEPRGWKAEADMKRANDGLGAGEGLGFSEKMSGTVGVAFPDVATIVGATIKDDGNGGVAVEGAQPVEEIGARTGSPSRSRAELKPGGGGQGGDPGGTRKSAQWQIRGSSPPLPELLPRREM